MWVARSEGSKRHATEYSASEAVVVAETLGVGIRKMLANEENSGEGKINMLNLEDVIALVGRPAGVVRKRLVASGSCLRRSLTLVGSTHGALRTARPPLGRRGWYRAERSPRRGGRHWDVGAGGRRIAMDTWRMSRSSSVTASLVLTQTGGLPVLQTRWSSWPVPCRHRTW